MEAYYQVKGGQGMIEYALIIVLISITAMMILSMLGQAIGDIFSEIILSI